MVAMYTGDWRIEGQGIWVMKTTDIGIHGHKNNFVQKHCLQMVLNTCIEPCSPPGLCVYSFVH